MSEMQRTDFMDLPKDDELVVAQRRLGLPPIGAPTGRRPRPALVPGSPVTKLPDLRLPARGALRVDALADRAPDPFDKAAAERASKMAERYATA